MAKMSIRLSTDKAHCTSLRVAGRLPFSVPQRFPVFPHFRRCILTRTTADGAFNAAEAEGAEVKPEPVEALEKVATSFTESHPLDITEDPEDDMFGTKELVQELSDTSQFGKRGEAWFFALAVVMLLVVFPPMRLQGLVELLSTLAISAGVVFLVYALFSLGRNFSPFPAPRKSNTLTTTGMYGYVRHPMYAGLLLLAFGVTIFTGSETRFALSCILWWVLEQKAALEEKLLEQLHPEYKDYRTKVKKFLPYVY